MNDVSFLSPLLVLSGAIAAFIGVRHQHLGGLIREKSPQISQSKEIYLSQRNKNILTQIFLFRKRNFLIRLSLFFALASSILIILNLYIFQFLPNSILITKTFSGLSLISLLISVGLLIREFGSSQDTLDLEILLHETEAMKYPFKNSRREYLMNLTIEIDKETDKS